MTKPVQEWRQKGLSISVWANDNGNSYQIRKSWKDKQSGEWKDMRMKLFPSELGLMGQLLMAAVNFQQNAGGFEPEERHLEAKASAYAPEATAVKNQWDSEDIPF
jgi:hypothetical protein